MRKRWLVLLFLIIAQMQLFAQCAMCNETARTSTSSKQEEAEALNDGIVYLLATPYIVVAIVIGVIIYINRKPKKEQNTAEEL